MGTTQHSIIIDAQIKPRLDDLSKVVNDLRSGLEQGVTKTDLTKGMGKDLSKLINKFQNDYSKLKSLTPNNLLKISDAADFQKTGESIIRTFRQIQQITSDIGTKSIIDVKKMFPDAFNARVTSLLERIEQLSKSASSIQQNEQQITELETKLGSLTSKLQDANSVDLNNLKKGAEEAKAAFEEAEKAVTSLKEKLSGGLKSNSVTDDIVNQAKQQREKAEKELEKTQARAKEISSKGITKQGKSYLLDGKNITQWREAKKGGDNRAAEAIEVLRLYKAQNDELSKQSQLLAQLTLVKSAQDKKPSEWTQEEATAVAAQLKQAEQLEATYKRLAVTKKESAAADQAYEKGSKKTRAVAGIQEEILQTEQAISVLRSSIDGLKKGRDLSGLSEAFKGLGINFSPQMLENAEGIKKLKEELEKVDQISFDALMAKLKSLGGQFPDIARALEAYERGLAGAKDETNDFLSSAQQLEQLKSRLSYFFGIANGIQLFKRTVRSAMNTVKELDAVMTETAVVTDFTVGDMWEKLPEYTKQASALGSSIKDLYSATTLYYQQGLDSKAAMGIGIETMKMARIAGMEASDATTAMTAALRGFNMEVNEMNAQRVNDVYSELAAITAADTNQIATAMGKTASIAASANMEFETTSALLAQIIETTQEAPETAGTAMKTIIARFTEVKELFSEGMLSGEDEEGEEININKIDAALKSVGISLKDFLKGSKGIDDIFLELASKWDTLDLATQRYIATTAAGSRQQSRFIAMMSNYERTMELVTAANNSAGASQEQFDKTLESMDTKIQNMKNAWNEFIMGLANQEVLKGGITVLTTILEVINKVLTFFSGGEGGNSGIKSILTLVTFISALMGGAKLIKKLFSYEFTKIFTSVEIKSKTTGIKVGSNLLGGVQRVAPQIENTLSNAITQGAVKGVQGANQAMSGLRIPGVAQPIVSGNTSGQTNVDSDGYEYESTLFNKAGTVPVVAGSTPETPQVPQELTFKEKMFQPATDGAIRATGAVTMLIGVLTNYVGQTIETQNGSEAAAKGFKAAGTAATLVGSAVTMLAPALAKLNASLGVIGIIAVAITAVVGAMAFAIQAAKEASPEGQLEAAQEATQKAGEAAEQAAASYDKLASSLDSVAEKSKNLEGLAKGTAEYKSTLADLNQEMLDLITMYPELNKYVESRNGQLVFKEGSESDVQAVKNEYAEAKISSQSALAAAQINEIEKLKNVEYDALNVKIRREVNDQGQTFEQWRQSAQGQKDIKNARYENPNITDREIFSQMFAGGLTFTDFQKETEQLAKDLYLNNIDREKAISELGIELYTEETKTKAINELREFGQALVEGETKAKLYQESILNNAKANIRATEEQKNAMQNFLSQSDISSLIDEQKQEILKKYGATHTNELSKNAMSELRKQYAEAMKYQMEGGKMYTYQDGQKIEVERTDEEIVQGLAGINVQDNITEDMQNFSKVLPSLQKDTDGLGAVFAKITSKGEGAALTFADLEKIRDYNVQMTKDAETGAVTFAEGSEMEALYKQVSGIWTAEEFYNLIQEAVVPTESREDIINRKTETMNISGLFEGIDIETGTIQGVVESLFDVFAVSGSQAAKNLGNTLDTEFDNLDPKQAQLFAEGLNLIDWSNLEQVEGLDSVLTDLGFDVDSLTIPIEDLENMIKEAAKSAKKFNLDTLKEEIKATSDLIEDLKDREDTERKFTKEEKERITKVDESLGGQFVATGIDEFVYIGDSIDGLVTALNNNTAALLAEYGEQVKYNADMSRGWEALKETEVWTHGGETGADSRGYNSYDVLAAIATADSVSSGAELIGSDFALEAVQNLMVQLGMGAAEAIEKMSASEMSELIRQHYDLYGSYAARQGNYNAETSYLENEEQIRLSQMSGQDILLDKDGTQEDKNAVLDSKITSIESGKVAAEYTYKDLWENSNNVALLPFKESAQDAKQYNNAIKATISDSAKLEKSMSKLSNTIKENASALKDSKGNGQAYQKALNKVAAQAKEVFGENYTEDFVEKNLSDFIDWANGVEGSTERIRDAMIENLEESGKMTNEARAAFEALDGLQFNIYGYANVSEAIGELYSTYEEAQAAANAIEALGMYEVTVVSLGKDEFGAPLGYDVIVSGAGTSAESANRKGGGGGGGGDKKEWENPYDELYNTVAKINEELRKREQLERRYQRLLDRNAATTQKILELNQASIDSLEEERKDRETVLSGRNQQMQDIMNDSKYADVKQYGYYDFDLGQIILNTDALEALDGSTDEELTSLVEEYIGKLEEQEEMIEEELDALEDINDAVWEIYNQGKDSYFSAEERIKEAIIEVEQKKIDALTNINESINDTNSKILDSLQKQIDESRQNRENQEVEEQISDTQRRISYLSQDTSGANALEIKELQKELDEQTEDYTDALIDQKISDLQEQNDMAAEQRQMQIDILQAQLDHWVESGEIWKKVQALMSASKDELGNLLSESSLIELLKKAENFKGLSEIDKMNWLNELNTTMSEAFSWISGGGAVQSLIGEGNQVEFIDASGNKVTGTINSKGEVVTDDGRIYGATSMNIAPNGAITSSETTEQAQTRWLEANPPAPEAPTEPERDYPYGKASETTADFFEGYWGEQASAIQWALKELGYYNYEIDSYYGKQTKAAVRRFQRDAEIPADGLVGDQTREQFRLRQYKTGGLADFTGPAWLDGTKARPEYVLNADQTKAFFNMVNVLESLQHGPTSRSSTENNGDINLDIDINVESIGSDYDVEQVADTIKRMIANDARYRNNNTVKLTR